MADLIEMQQNVSRNLLGFIPSLVVQQILSIKNQNKKIEFPFKTSIHSVVMFADVISCLFSRPDSLSSYDLADFWFHGSFRVTSKLW